MRSRHYPVAVRRFSLTEIEYEAARVAQRLLGKAVEEGGPESFEDAASAAGERVVASMLSLEVASVYDDWFILLKEHVDDSLAREGVGPFNPFSQMRNALKHYLAASVLARRAMVTEGRVPAWEDKTP